MSSDFAEFTVSYGKNDAEQITSVVINGGNPNQVIWNMNQVKPAMNALQDLSLDKYVVVPGFHRLAVIDRDVAVGAGIVHSSYDGLEVNAPQSGWQLLDYYDGSWVDGNFKNREHFSNAVKKHTFIRKITSGEGITICINSLSERFIFRAIEKMAAGKELGRQMSKSDVASSLDNRRAFANIDRGTAAPSSVLIHDVDGNEVDMFSLPSGAVVKRYAKNGDSRKPTYWIPGKPDNVKMWEQYAQAGQTIACS